MVYVKCLEDGLISWPETEAALLHYGADKRCEKVAMVTLGYSGQVAINGERLIASATQQCDSLV